MEPTSEVDSIFLKTHLVGGGRAEQQGAGWRLTLPATTDAAYSDAQLDDYDVVVRDFVHRPPLRLKLRARFSSNTLKGTAGFGFWNHPFGQEGQMQAAPQNVWFFHSSPESDLRVVRGVPGHGFKAAMLNSPQITSATAMPRRVGRLLDRLLVIRPLARMAMAAAQSVVRAGETRLSTDMTRWHEYELDWRADEAVFRVDRQDVLRVPKPPMGPLGLVMWIDNYRAVAAEGRYEFGYVACADEQWMEVEVLTQEFRV